MPLHCVNGSYPPSNGIFADDYPQEKAASAAALYEKGSPPQISRTIQQTDQIHRLCLDRENMDVVLKINY
jgi:hypothetical protein